MDEFINLFIQIRITDIIDIAFVAFVIFKILEFIRETRAEQLVKGLLFIIIITGVSYWLQLHAIFWILRNTMTLGTIALIIVFQPELRRALEYLGRGKFLTRSFIEIDKEVAEEITESIISAVSYLTKHNIGALIIIERETAVGDVIETGTTLNAEISDQLLLNIFNTNAPLHDGAVIIRGKNILAAGCVLPLSQNKNLSKELGTRHRAGIGITEHSDAVALIVSEETGAISISIDGKLSRFLDIKSVERILMNVYVNKAQQRYTIMPLVKKIWRQKS
ncbi:MAG: diadenylate cyclase CdaA [Clostridia bacterium]|nr:diadenylate cyclase CdaA [Clostridia bacterium]